MVLVNNGSLARPPPSTPSIKTHPPYPPQKPKVLEPNPNPPSPPTPNPEPQIQFPWRRVAHDVGRVHLQHQPLCRRDVPLPRVEVLDTSLRRGKSEIPRFSSSEVGIHGGWGGGEGKPKYVRNKAVLTAPSPPAPMRYQFQLEILYITPKSAVTSSILITTDIWHRDPTSWFLNHSGNIEIWPASEEVGD